MAMGGRRTGGNRRRVGWYKANRASQEDSFAPPFLPFPPLPPPLNFPPALFTPPPGYLLSYFARPGIVFSCLLILALLFRVTLTTNLCFLSPLWKTFALHLLALRSLSLSLSFALSAVWNFAVSNSLSEPRFRYRTFVALEWNSLFHAFHSTLIFWLYIYIYIFWRYYYSVSFIPVISFVELIYIIFMRFFFSFLLQMKSIVYLLRESVIDVR